MLERRRARRRLAMMTQRMNEPLIATQTTRAIRAAVAIGSAQEPPVAVLWSDVAEMVAVEPSSGADHLRPCAPDSVVISSPS